MLGGAANEFQQAARIPDTALKKVSAQGDRVAVQVHHKRGQATAVLPVDTQTQRERQSSRRVSSIDLSIEDFFADGRPADLPLKFDPDAMCIEHAELVGND